MKRSSAQLKQLAREALNGKYGTFIGALVIYNILTFSISIIITLLLPGYPITMFLVKYLVIFVFALFYAILRAGMSYQALNTARKKDIAVGNLFYALSLHPDRFIIASLLISLIGFPLGFILGIGHFFLSYMRYSMLSIPVFSLLFIVMLIIVISILLRFALCGFLLLDYPDMRATKALETSSKLMKGNKGRYFYLSLSFLGLFLLGILSVGVAFLWIIPYINATTAYFYLDVIGELDSKENTPETENPTPMDGFSSYGGLDTDMFPPRTGNSYPNNLDDFR